MNAATLSRLKLKDGAAVVIGRDSSCDIRVEDKAAFELIRSYSPYDQVAAQVDDVVDVLDVDGALLHACTARGARPDDVVVDDPRNERNETVLAGIEMRTLYFDIAWLKREQRSASLKAEFSSGRV